MQLIVALDNNDPWKLYNELYCTAKWFKVGATGLLKSAELIHAILEDGNKIMLDLKLYDTQDTIKRTLEAIDLLGIQMTTIHVECSKFAEGFSTRIIIVDKLTDGTGFQVPSTFWGDGIVCPASYAKFIRQATLGKLLICPGIRLDDVKDNHTETATPKEAKETGADFIVVGRPIYNSPNPVKVVEEILEYCD